MPATPIVEPDTTPRAFSMGNSSLNDKLEALETKLCGKIMAMKSYFMNELRSLKQEAPVIKNRNYNQDNTTVLKSRIKLLELENQLLKCDVSKKQKFIDTILEHNSNLSHNIDVTSASTTTYDQHVTREPQHIDDTDRSGTEHNDRQKHDYKSNRENKKRDDNNKEKKKSNEDNLPTDTNKKNVYILGDSIVKHVEGWKLKNSLGNNHNVYVRSFPGAKVKCMKDYVKPCIRENNPEYVILHVGTNELNSELTPERIAKSVIDVGKNIQINHTTVSISSIVPRNDNFNNKATEVSKELSKMCKKGRLLFVDHSSINPKAHLNRSKLHLKRHGYEKLGKNFVSFIRNNYA